MIFYIGFAREYDDRYHYAGELSSSAMTKYTCKLLTDVDQCILWNCRYPKLGAKIFGRIYKYIYVNVKIIFICYQHGRHDLTIVVYHAPLVIPALVLLRAFKFKVILQVNEIYSNATLKPRRLWGYLEKLHINAHSKYIAASQLIFKDLLRGPASTLSVVTLPGPLSLRENTMSLAPNTSVRAGFKTKAPLRFVYGGVICNKKKTGAILSLEFFQKLPDQNNIQLDIYGYGAQGCINVLKEKIQQNTNDNIRFMDSVEPEQFTCLLSDYDIGLAIEPVEALNSSTSYPSKILTYLGAGLNVIASDTPAVLDNDIDGLVLSAGKFNGLTTEAFKSAVFHSKEEIHTGTKRYQTSIIQQLNELIGD